MRAFESQKSALGIPTIPFASELGVYRTFVKNAIKLYRIVRAAFK